MTIGEKIRYRRQQMGFSVRELAEKVGVTPILREQLDQLEADRAIMKADLEKLESGPRLSADVIRQGLQLSLLEDHVDDAAVIRIFVHRVVLHEDRILLEFNIQAAEGLETSELLGFELDGDWWSIGDAGRTLTIYRGRVLALCSW